MRVTLECGCTVDDARVSTVHELDGRHYPLGTSPKTYCMVCDLFRPCAHVTFACTFIHPRDTTCGGCSQLQRGGGAE